MPTNTCPTCTGSRSCTFARTHLGQCYFTLDLDQQAFLVRMGAALAEQPAGESEPIYSSMSEKVARVQNIIACFMVYAPVASAMGTAATVVGKGIR